MSFSLSHLLLGLVILPFVWIGFDFVMGLWWDRRAKRAVQREARSCHLCGKLYPEGKRVKVSTCPECAGRNLREGHRKLG